MFQPGKEQEEDGGTYVPRNSEPNIYLLYRCLRCVCVCVCSAPVSMQSCCTLLHNIFQDESQLIYLKGEIIQTQ